jgi:hypothetical protein
MDVKRCGHEESLLTDGDTNKFLQNSIHLAKQNRSNSPGENNCSCTVEPEADWRSALDLYDKVARLPLENTSIQGYSKWQLWSEMVTFQLKRYFFSMYSIYENSVPGP